MDLPGKFFKSQFTLKKGKLKKAQPKHLKSAMHGFDPCASYSIFRARITPSHQEGGQVLK